jgi:hypothetical protein
MRDRVRWGEISLWIAILGCRRRASPEDVGIL